MQHRLTLPLCFFVVGLGHIAALWLDLYRLVPVALLLAAALVYFSGANARPYTTRVTRGLILVAPVYLYTLLSTFWSPDPATALRDALYICAAVFPGMIFGISIGRAYTGLKITAGLCFLLVPFVVQAVVSAYMRGDPMLVGNGSMRSLLAFVIIFLSPIFAGAWALTRRHKFLFCLLIDLVLAVTIDSRSAIIFAVPAAIVSMFIQDRRLTWRVARLMIVPLVGALFVFGPLIFERFSSHDTQLSVGESVLDDFRVPVEERVDFDRRLTTFTAVKTFLENPVFGRGYSSILQIHQADYRMELTAHGLIPGTLAELGLIGISIMAYLFWRTSSRARRANKLRAACDFDPMLVHFLISFGALLGAGMFHQLIESVFFGLILGILIGMGSSLRLNSVKTHAAQRSRSVSS